MYRVYCAFSGDLNKDSWRDMRQIHIIKIGSTNMSRADRKDRMKKGWKLGGRLRGQPLAGKGDWDIIDWWPVGEDEQIARNIEKEVRSWFEQRAGVPFKLFAKLKREFGGRSNLGGIGELIPVSVSRLKGALPFSHLALAGFIQIPRI